MTVSAIKVVGDRLKAAPTVAAVIGERVYATRAPQEPGHPHIVLALTGGAPGFDLDGLATQESRVLVACYGRTFEQAESAALAVAGVLDSAAVTVAGQELRIARGSEDLADYLEKPGLFRRATLFEVHL